MLAHNHPAVTVAAASAPTVAHLLDLTPLLQEGAAIMTIIYMACQIWAFIKGKK